jgi:hypothetical protein
MPDFTHHTQYVQLFQMLKFTTLHKPYKTGFKKKVSKNIIIIINKNKPVALVCKQTIPTEVGIIL